MEYLDHSGFVSVEEQEPLAFRQFLDEVGDQPSLIHSQLLTIVIYAQGEEMRSYNCQEVSVLVARTGLSRVLSIWETSEVFSP